MPFTNGWLEQQKRVQQLEMLQLQDQSWCAAYGKCVYFSSPNEPDITIPNGLGWDILSPSAEILPDKKNLLELIGVKRASVGDVRMTIGRIYYVSVVGTSTAKYSIFAARHLRFLYLTEHLLEDHETYQKISIYDLSGALRNPRSSRMYVWNTDPTGVACLFDTTAAGNSPGSGAPGRKVTFLHQSYFSNSPAQLERQSLDWKEWLHARFSIQRMIPLLN